MNKKRKERMARTSEHGLEMRHVSSEGEEQEKGVAVSPQMVTTCWSSPSWMGRVKKRQIFGIAMLIVVDLIWVGSAGLTRYLFHQQSYDKPLFTVYFKTCLFTIYLLPFVFWRPWQRLCCIDPLWCCMRWKRRRECESETGDDDVFEYPQDSKQKQQQLYHQVSTSGVLSNNSCSITSSVESISNSGGYMLGPSVYKPLRRNGTDERELPLSLTLPDPPLSIQQESLQFTTSDIFVRRKRLSRVRFSQTVEVKHVPIVSSNDDGHVSANPSPVNEPVVVVAVRKVFILAVPFGLLWFFANYLYALALDSQSVGLVNTLSSLSGVFVLILAAIPLPKVSPKDKFTLTKLVIISISVGGAVLVGMAPNGSDNGDLTLNIGAVYAAGGACLYAGYLVLLTKAVSDEDSLEIPMFFGFVGLLVSLILAPLVVFWDFIKWEEFELPPTNMVWTLLLVNGFVGTVLSELLWLWGCLLTSTLVGTLSLSLVTPLSITYSIVTGETPVSTFFVLGAVLTVLAFIMIAIINHQSGWDPMWLLIKNLVKHARSYKYLHILSLESQSLLTEQDNFLHDSAVLT